MVMPRPCLFVEEKRGNLRSKLAIHLSTSANASISARLPTKSISPCPAHHIQRVAVRRIHSLDGQHTDAVTESSTIPDTKTIWLFRDRIAQAGLGTKLFDQVRSSCWRTGIWRGQIMDAPLVQAPIQRNKREEAEAVKKSTDTHFLGGVTNARKKTSMQSVRRAWQEPLRLQSS